MSTESPTIIKKIKRHKGEAGHGGAWKVAYADMVTILMMFFMVLWLIQVTQQKERNKIVQQMSGEILQKGGMSEFNVQSSDSIINLGGSGGKSPIGASSNKPAINHTENTAGSQLLSKDKQDKVHHLVLKDGYASFADLQLLAKQIRHMAAGIHKDNHLQVKVVPQGIRIVINDNKDQAMFKSGKAQMEPYFEDLLLNLAPLLAQIKNQVVISGHTDAFPYLGHEYSNWDLSSERALQARRALAAGGMKNSQFFEVIGMADRISAVKGQPFNKKNRRIGILVLTHAAEDAMVKSFTETIEAKSQSEAMANQ